MIVPFIVPSSSWFYLMAPLGRGSCLCTFFRSCYPFMIHIWLNRAHLHALGHECSSSVTSLNTLSPRCGPRQSVHHLGDVNSDSPGLKLVFASKVPVSIRLAKHFQPSSDHSSSHPCRSIASGRSRLERSNASKHDPASWRARAQTLVVRA